MVLNSLLFSLNATVPVFLLIALGFILYRFRLLNRSFCAVSDGLVFYIALPVMLFCDIASTDIRGNMDLPYLLFCAVITTVIFFTIWGGAKLFLKDKTLIGEFVQVSYRSSSVILGCAMLRGMYGNISMAPLMILGSVPLFNIYAILVLTLEGPHKKEGALGTRLKQGLIDVCKNPIILAILLGFAASYFGMPAFPPIINSVLSNLAALVTPLALLSIGAGFQLKHALHHPRPTLVATGIKLFVLPALGLPLAILFGFTGEKLAALIMMLGSTASPTCYIMARNLGHKGHFSISVIVLTTLLSSFSLTLWIFLARYLGYLT